MREEYRKWRDSLPSAEGDLETLLAQEDRRDDALAAALNDYRAELDEVGGHLRHHEGGLPLLESTTDHSTRDLPETSERHEVYVGLINDFIDILDKKWGEQAMQRALDEKDRAIAEKDRRIAEKDRAIKEKKRAIAEKDRAIEDRKRTIEALLIRKEELLRIRENRVRADAAWARAFAERTGGTVRTNPPLQ